jgi:hypothetical protein
MVAQGTVRMTRRPVVEIPCLSAAVAALPWWEERRAVISVGVAPFGEMFVGEESQLFISPGATSEMSLEVSDLWFI